MVLFGEGSAEDFLSLHIGEVVIAILLVSIPFIQSGSPSLVPYLSSLILVVKFISSCTMTGQTKALTDSSEETYSQGFFRCVLVD